MALTLTWTAHTEIGLVRKNNQDSAYVSPTMIMVADGMGGAAAGDLASAVAILELRDTDVSLAERLVPASDDDKPDVLGVLAGALQRANDHLNDLIADDPALDGMGTTVCGFILFEDALAMVNIGDSRAYRLRDGVLERLTHDHSWVQTLVDDGRISEAEALQHPHRSLVLRVLNGSPAHRPDLQWADLRAGDRLLVCSDGLCGLVTDAAISERVRIADRDEAVGALVGLAHAAGGYDNITIVLTDVVVDGPLGAPAILGSAEDAALPETEDTATIDPIVIDAADAAASEERVITERDRYALTGRRRPATVVKLALGLLLPLLAIGGAGWGWFSYTQTRVYIGSHTEQVAIFAGVPDTILGRPLSHVVETDATRVADLPPYFAERVKATIAVENLDRARVTVAELRAKAAQCIAQREARAKATAAPVSTPPVTPATPGASVTPDPATTPAVSPGASGSPAPSTPGVGSTAEVTPSPTLSHTPVTSPEEC